MSETGAWFLGGYKQGMQGTLGQSLALDATDNLGWALVAWKEELAFNGFAGAMNLRNPIIGIAADQAIRAFQTANDLDADGIIGPHTGKALLQKRIRVEATLYAFVNVADMRGIVAHESGFDLGAIGTVDNADRGAAQIHLYPGGVSLSQAIQPKFAFGRLASQLHHLANLYDEEAAVVSWNVGEGGAAWWYAEGRPAHGSPSWWTDGDLGARATAYLAAVRSLGA